MSTLNEYFITLRVEARFEGEWSTDSICGLSLSLSQAERLTGTLPNSSSMCYQGLEREALIALNGIAANSCLCEFVMLEFVCQ